MSKQVIELEKEFIGGGRVKGFEFKQLYKSEHAYLYEVKANGGFYYEIFERKTSPICIDFAKRIYSETEFKETYPKAEAFGVSAWTTPNLDKACEYFNEFGRKAQEKIELNKAV